MNVRRGLRALYAVLPFKQPVFELVRSHMPLPRAVFQHLHFSGVVKITIDEDSNFRVRHKGFQVENDLFWAGYGNGWEATSLRLWARLARYARTVFDVGANTGVYALAAKSVNPAAQVFAFEPVERIATWLRENVALNGYAIEVVIAGVSSSSGEEVIYEPATPHSYSASLNPDMLRGRANLAETRIVTTRMDEFALSRGLTSTDLFKIDVEMHESEVLSGFGDLIGRNRPTFLIEILNRALGDRVEAFVAGFDYVFYGIAEGASVEKVATLGATQRNYLVCPREFAAKMQLGEGVAHGELS